MTYPQYGPNSPEFALLHRRDLCLEATRPLFERHQEELFAGIVSTALTDSQMHELVDYRLHLRAIEMHPEFPNVCLPAAPSFCALVRAIDECFKRQQERAA
jgi:hypothetical protein